MISLLALSLFHQAEANQASCSTYVGVVGKCTNGGAVPASGTIPDCNADPCVAGDLDTCCVISADPVDPAAAKCDASIAKCDKAKDFETDKCGQFDKDKCVKPDCCKSAEDPKCNASIAKCDKAKDFETDKCGQFDKDKCVKPDCCKSDAEPVPCDKDMKCKDKKHCVQIETAAGSGRRLAAKAEKKGCADAKKECTKKSDKCEEVKGCTKDGDSCKFDPVTGCICSASMAGIFVAMMALLV